MRTATRGAALVGPLLWAVTAISMAGEPVYPVKVSDNGRYFVDQNGDPVFWLGTTQWQLFREYTQEEARTILAKTKARGFTFVQVMLMGVGDGTQPNVYGEKAWIDDNPLTPNEAYFKKVDAVVRIARENNVVISMTLFHQRYREHITLDNARAWGHWVAARYKEVPTIVWSMTPEATQLGVLKRVFLERFQWWHLVPDQSILASGGNTRGKVLNLAARHKDGQWIMVYLGSKTAFSVNMNKVTAGDKVDAFWIDPRSGESTAIGRYSNTGVQWFSTPDSWEDALLVLEPSKS